MACATLSTSSSRSDVFSLGVIAYQMLTGRLPYGAEVAKTKTKSQQRKLRYASALDDNRTLPAWIDEVLKKAVHPDPTRRSEEPSELAFALRHPDKDSLNMASVPLIDRNPLLFWKGLCAFLALAILVLLFIQFGHRP